MRDLRNFQKPQLDDSQVLDRLSRKRLLITGASGLIGKNLVARLLTLNKIHGLGLQIVAASKSGIFEGLENSYEEFRIAAGDLNSPSFIDALGEFDFTIHAAGYAQPGLFMADPLSTISINTSATLALVKKTKDTFMFLSSSEVYSGSTQAPFDEEQIGNTSPSHPRAAYIEGKRAGETIALTAADGMGIRSIVARVSSAYGPGTGLGDKRVLSELIIRGLTEGLVVLNGGFNKVRTYGHVDDVGQILIALLGHAPTGVFNVGGVSRVTLGDLSQLVANLTGAENGTKSNQSPHDGSPELVELDLEKTLSTIPPFRFTDLEAGLNQTVEWYRELIQHHT